MILNIIHPLINSLLTNNQNRFRPERSITTHILSIIRLIEGRQSNNLKAIITFVNFRKAFDRINISSMFNIISAYGTPRAIIDI